MKKYRTLEMIIRETLVDSDKCNRILSQVLNKKDPMEYLTDQVIKMKSSKNKFFLTMTDQEALDWLTYKNILKGIPGTEEHADCISYWRKPVGKKSPSIIKSIYTKESNDLKRNLWIEYHDDGSRDNLRSVSNFTEYSIPGLSSQGELNYISMACGSYLVKHLGEEQKYDPRYEGNDWGSGMVKLYPVHIQELVIEYRRE